MAVSLSVNKQSLNSLGKRLDQIQSLIETKVTQRFFEMSLDWLKTQSITYLRQNYPQREDQSRIAEIENEFEYEIIGDKARLINNHKQAVYVEFGIGIVGRGTHPQSSNAKIGAGGYEYNLPSEAKEHAKNITEQEDSWFYRGLTQGNIASLFMYNALMDYQHRQVYVWIYQQAMDEVLKKYKKK